MDKFHLTKRNDEWRLEKAGSNRAVVKADTKAEAMSNAMKYMNKHGGSMRVHKETGAFQEERTYPGSADPKKTPG